jgi:hypothetical protein
MSDVSKTNDEEQNEIRIYQLISTGLIEATPENWNSAILKLNYSDDCLSHCILSDEGHQEIVSASEEIFSATRELEILLKSNKKMFSSALLRVWMNENDLWKYSIEFTYE